MRRFGWVVFIGLILGLAGCESDSDNAKSTSGPGISVHCAAQVPIGDTTTVVKCAPQEAKK